MEQEKIQVNLSRSAGGGGANQEGNKLDDMDGSHDEGHTGDVMPAAATREEYVFVLLLLFLFLLFSRGGRGGEGILGCMDVIQG